MLTFNDYTIQESKNLHLEHLEDEIINTGSDGGRSALNFLQSLRDMLAGNSKSELGVTVKFDGAPAIFAGINPENNKFFVGTKAIFNKTPKLNYTEEDINKNHKGGLADTLKIALKELPKLGIKKGVYQGDIMFTQSILSSKSYDGKKYLTFQPNTIIYAVPAKSDFAKTIRKAKIGVVFHTYYDGATIDGLTGSFNINIGGFNKTSSIWFQDANLQDESGVASFTKSDTAKVNLLLSNAGKALKRAGRDISKFIEWQQSFKAGTIGASYKTFTNTYIRNGQPIPKTLYNDYEAYLGTWWEEKVIGKVKTDNAKNIKREILVHHMQQLKKYKKVIESIAQYQNYIVQAKEMIIKKLEQIKGKLNTFVATSDGFKVTVPEGFVAVDRLTGSAVKLVDRLEFAHNNFTAVKNWSKT